MKKSRQNGPPDFPLYVRLILFAVGVLLFVGAMALFEVNLTLTIILFALGIFTALTGVGYSRKDNRSPGGFQELGHQRTVSQYAKTAYTRKEDVPLNPWDTVSAPKSAPEVEEKLKKCKDPWE